LLHESKFNAKAPIFHEHWVLGVASSECSPLVDVFK
jgi:hypothetical protein